MSSFPHFFHQPSDCWGYAGCVDLSQKIRIVLAARQERPADLSARAELSASTISNVMKAGSTTVGTALKLARALDVSLDWLADEQQGLPAVPAGETFSFTRMLSAEQRAKFEAYLGHYEREVVLAAAARLLCEADDETAGGVLHPNVVLRAKLGRSAKVSGTGEAIIHGRRRRIERRGDAPASAS